jgi:hypothetical protein
MGSLRIISSIILHFEPGLKDKIIDPSSKKANILLTEIFTSVPRIRFVFSLLQEFYLAPNTIANKAKYFALFLDFLQRNSKHNDIDMFPQIDQCDRYDNYV